jgi:rubrerythrin
VLDQETTSSGDADGFVRFFGAGTPARGEFHCSECGYGVTVQAKLPICPMCGGDAWEQSASSPLSRTALWPL